MLDNALRKRLLRDFEKGQNVPTLSASSTYILLREGDMIYFAKQNYPDREFFYMAIPGPKEILKM